VIVIGQNWNQAQFEHLDVESGLSSNMIYCIHRDANGFLWVGTDNGLNRYDGYQFRPFRNRIGDNTSISNNHITSIYEDVDGSLWIATWKFINRYNPVNGQFKTYSYPTNSASELDCRTNHIEKWNKDTLLVSTNKGPALMSKKTGEYLFFRVKPHEKIAEQDYVFGLKRLPNNEVLVSTFDDLYVINPYHISTNKVDLASLKMHKNYAHVTGKITPFKKHEWLIETWNMDLLIYNDENKQIRNHFFGKPYNNLDYGGGALTILKSNDGYLFGTNGSGIYITDNNLKEKYHIAYDEKYKHSISSNYITSIICDKEGIFWIGTDKGLNKFDPSKQKLNLHLFNFKSPYFNDEDRIFDIFITKDHHLFLQGIWGSYYLNEKENKSVFLEKLNTKKFQNLFGTPFYIKDSLVCLPRAGGFQTFYYNFKNNQINCENLKEFPIKKQFNSPNDVDYFNHNYYVLFNKESLFKVNENTGIIEKLKLSLPNKNELIAERFNVLEPKINSNNTFYLGTAPQGLYEINIKTLEAKKINIDIIPQNDILNVTKICQHKNGNIWLATEFHGVLFYDAKSQHWQSLKENDLIANNHIRNLSFIGDSLLAIAINDAFFILNLNNQNFIKIGSSDGLSDESIPASFHVQKDKIYFAHEKGYLETDFNFLLKKNNKNAVVFTEIYSSKHNTYLANNRHAINLSYPENSFRISFAKQSMINSQQNKFQYKFEGSNSGWSELGTNHELVLHKLPYGSYQLFIKEIGNTENNKMQMAILEITVQAPFYLQTWFILVFTLFFIGLIILIYRISLLRKIAVLKTRDIIARDLHDEVGSALTSISYLSEMGKIQKAEGTGTFDKIGETSRSITSLMNDIIWAINPDKDQAISLIQRINYFIQEHQRQNEISISFDYSDKLKMHAFTMVERKNLFLIFKEALNNAFKYANADNIYIRLLKESTSIILEIEDNGIGMQIDEKNQGNGLNNMKKRASDMGAHFEILSVVNKGTKVRIILNHHNWGGR
jgi:signal transduction histidine kinase